MEAHKATFTYLNIRQSIAVMVTKLVLADLVFATIIIGLYSALVAGDRFYDLALTDSNLFVIAFVAIGLFKIYISIFIVLQWLNEYYEFTPEYIYHKKGIIFRKTEKYRLEIIRRIDVEDTFFGQLFNFATINIYDTRLNNIVDLYLIHNPVRYAKVLLELKPDIEVRDQRLRLPVLPSIDIDEGPDPALNQ